MTTDSQADHLEHRHRETLRKLFEHPTSHNIEWREVESLLNAIGAVENRSDGKIKITLGPNSQVIERPKAKDVGADEIAELRKLLRYAGYGVDGP